MTALAGAFMILALGPVLPTPALLLYLLVRI